MIISINYYTVINYCPQFLARLLINAVINLCLSNGSRGRWFQVQEFSGKCGRSTKQHNSSNLRSLQNELREREF